MRVLLAKVRPNEDISTAIEAICSDHEITRANVYGIGSPNEVRFTDGRRVEAHATEVLIREGKVEEVHGQPRASIRIDVVDLEGQVLLRANRPWRQPGLHHLRVGHRGTRPALGAVEATRHGSSGP